MLSRRNILGLLASAAAALAVPVQADEPVNGLNVTLIKYAPFEGYADGTFRSRGHGKWVEKTSDGKTHNFVEMNKTAKKLTLWDNKRGALVTIAMRIGGKLTWEWNGSPVTPYAVVTDLED